ncbi:MAG: 50S ribosomal protein L1 [bacterium]|nr:50S ribosomal protein L1 [bacterium]
MGKSKRYMASSELVESTRLYDVGEALELLKKTATAKFDETVECAMKLGVDPKHAEQNVRGTVVLPHGTGKTVRVLVLTRGEKETEAETAGADYVGMDYMEKIQKEGWLDFEAVVATPDVMRDVGKLGRILGPRGLMPNPKTGTMTFDVAQAVKELKAGRIEYRVDKHGIIHVPVGKVSLETDKLIDNLLTLCEAVIRARPASCKGLYVRGIFLSSTMGPGLKLDSVKTQAAVAARR